MRLWSINPTSLDKAALGACWREGLLARKVLLGQTRGYRNHPQLLRFKAAADPIAQIDAYLHSIVDAADLRGYNYDRTKLGSRATTLPLLNVTSGQLAYEYQHLTNKVSTRDPKWLPNLHLSVNPTMQLVDGNVEEWEKV